MDGLPRLGWSDTLHRGNVLHFHPQHIPGMDAAGLRWGQRRNGLIEPPDQLGVFGLFLFLYDVVLRRWLRPADGGFFNPIVTVKGVVGLVAVRSLAASARLSSRNASTISSDTSTKVSSVQNG